MPLLRVLRPTLPILIGASIMLTLSMGLRQSLGIFMQPLTHDIHISISDFTLALAVQNLAWGFLQPLAGAMTVRYGFRPIMIVGSLMYIAGLILMATAGGLVSIMIGAGVLIGTSLACTAAAIAMSVAARAVPETVRSTVLGIVSGAGSLGALLSAPIGQLLNEGFGWRIGLAGFVIMSVLMIPAAWYAGRVDKVPLPKPAADDIGDATAASVATARVRQRLLRGDDLRLSRLRHAARVSHDAPAVLPRDLRPRSDAERADARHDRRLQRAGLAVLRLGRPALE
ncbi:MFS family permease [Bradyrhizobium diazoefficiens]